MKTIFFYANIRTYDHTLGITRKVYSEIKAFRKQGYQVIYSGYLEDGVAIFDNDDNVIMRRKYWIANERISHLTRREKIMSLCIDYMHQYEGDFDFSYVRYHFFDRKYIELLKALKKRSAKVIIEAHSTPKFPHDMSIMHYVGWKDKRWNKYAKTYVDMVASMSDEETLWGIETVKISNGIDVGKIRLHNYHGNVGDINLIAVSFEGPVHGYDRVIRGMYEYYKNEGKRNLYFHMVGTTQTSTDKLIEKLGLGDRCFKYGKMMGEKLDDVYDKANMGVGCLANHRIGSTYGSALKTKEYIAKGIPFIYGWKEKVLENFEYGLSFELCEEPIDMKEVINFYDSLPTQGLANKIRSHLGFEDTWDFQMKKVIDSINNL